MVSKKEQLIKEISSRVISYFVLNNFDAKRNKTDGALSAEDFLAGLFNILYKEELDCKFENVNKIPNYPGIDLLDKNISIAVQVTVNERADKIRNTFNVIPSVEKNDDYHTIWFFIQAMHLTPGQKKIEPTHSGYTTRVIGITELLNEISDINDLDLLKKIHVYVKSMLVIPDIDLDAVNIDAAVFDVLFRALKDRSETTSTELEEIYKTSPSEKKEKHAEQWDLLISLYRESLGVTNDEIDLHRLKNYRSLVEEIFSEDLDEVQKESIQTYLRTQSLLILHDCEGDAVKGIQKLCEHLRNDLKITFVPYTHILSFCLNMFFSCDVFPLIMASYEKK